eukprot:TRINITY_DN15841_c0_g1_i6.p2 TRINITY_DN15841_c0_g1~~TRINITY_DN15841_c0_g1_i6.p2  ORF type:complete len:396 (+),score=72.46 TRINITY_DN15841_c0_g1_i6:772-1959(+)
MLPSWVDVFFEATPPHFDDWVGVEHDGSKSRGWQRAAWSQFYFDRYTSADFIAQMDADAILQTFVDEELLFDHDGRPRMTGYQVIKNSHTYRHVMLALRLPADLEFMAAQPMLFHRSHFQPTRDFITSRMNASDFDAAFAKLTEAVLVNNTGRSGSLPETSIYHLPCHQTAMGAYLWHHHRAAYSWHIMWSRGGINAVRRWDVARGGPESKPPESRYLCPQVYVGNHIGGWGMLDNKGFSRSKSAEPVQGGHRYMMFSAELLLGQLCNIREAVRIHMSERDASLADELLRIPTGTSLQAATGAAASKTPPFSPAKLCSAFGLRTKSVNVLLSLGSLVFWQFTRGTDSLFQYHLQFCSTCESLVEVWERHAARSAIHYLKRRKLWEKHDHAASVTR